MPTTSLPDELQFLRSSTPDEVSTVRFLERLGVPSSTCYYRCRPGGPWQRLLPGVVLLHSGRPSERQRLRAALLHAGKGSMVTGLAACHLYGLRRAAPPDVHVLVDARRQVRSAGHTVVERTVRLPQPVDVGGIPCAPVVRSALDAARRLPTVDAVRALLAESVQRGRCTPDQLRAELDRGSSRGSAVARTVLAEVSDGVRSVAEADARVLWQRSGLPPLRWNVPIHDAGGLLLGVPDGWADEVGLAWEIDSYEFHLSPADYRATLAKRGRMTAAGIVVVHTLPRRLRFEPAAVLDELRAHHATALLRPRPPVHVRPR